MDPNKYNMKIIYQNESFNSALVEQRKYDIFQRIILLLQSNSRTEGNSWEKMCSVIVSDHTNYLWFVFRKRNLNKLLFFLLYGWNARNERISRLNYFFVAEFCRLLVFWPWSYTNSLLKIGVFIILIKPFQSRFFSEEWRYFNFILNNLERYSKLLKI